MTSRHPLMTPEEVAAAFKVDPKTVTRWAKAGRLLAVRTGGGHRRYFAAEITALIAGLEPEAARKAAEAARDEMTGSVRA